MKKLFLLIVVLCLSGFALADDIQFPGGFLTEVLATNGTNAAGIYWVNRLGQPTAILFTYEGGIYTALYPLQPFDNDPVISMNSSGALAGTAGQGPDGSVGFDSLCSYDGCVNDMVQKWYLLRGITSIDVGGTDETVATWYPFQVYGLSIDEQDNVFGWFQPGEISLINGPFPMGGFAIHDGEVYFDYTVYLGDGDGGTALQTVEQYSLNGGNFTPLVPPIPEPSSLVLLSSSLILAGYLRRKLIRP